MRIKLLATILLIVKIGIAQSIDPKLKLGKNCYWGLIDSNTEQKVIDYQYEYIELFELSSNYLAIAQFQKKKHIFLISDTIMMLPFKHIEILNKDLLKVKINHLCGLINSNGRGILLPKYDNIELNHQCIITESNHQYKLMDLATKPINNHIYAQKISWNESLLWLKSKDEYHLLNTKDRNIQVFKMDSIDVINENYTIVYSNNQKKLLTINLDTLELNTNSTFYFAADLFIDASQDGLYCMHMKLDTLWHQKNSGVAQKGNFYIIHNNDSIRIYSATARHFHPSIKSQRLVLLNDNLIKTESDKLYSSISTFVLTDFENYHIKEGAKGFFIQSNKKWKWYNDHFISKNKEYDQISDLKNAAYYLVYDEQSNIGLMDLSGKMIFATAFKSIVPKRNLFEVLDQNASRYFMDKYQNKYHCRP